MNFKEQVLSLDEKALVTVLIEAHRSEVTKNLTPEYIKELLPTEQLLREALLTEVETNIIAQAAVTYIPVFLEKNLLDNDLVIDCLENIEIALGLTIQMKDFSDNRKQIKALFLKENDFYNSAFEIADNYLDTLDEDRLEELGHDFSGKDMLDQLMINMIFIREFKHSDDRRTEYLKNPLNDMSYD